MKAKDYFEEKKSNMRELWNLSDVQRDMVCSLMEQYVALHIADVSHRLLRELRKTYLVNLDNDGQPKASMAEIMDLWDRVNRELQIVTID